MIPNLLGTEFRQLDHRVDPRDPLVMEYVKDKGRNELAAVAYDLNVMGRWVHGWLPLPSVLSTMHERH